MFQRILSCVALCPIVLLGATGLHAAPPTTEPQVAGDPQGNIAQVAHIPASNPSTDRAPMPSNATATSATKAFPTPAELWAKIKAPKEAASKLAGVAYFDLDRPVQDAPVAFSLFGDNTLTVHDLVKRLHQARDDNAVRAVLINFGGTNFNLSQAHELRNALDDVRRSGKRSFVYADSFDTDTYVAATGATDICMLGGGEIMIPGIGLQTMFYKGLFDKLGVKADYVQIGEYKGADESYTRLGSSDELKGELNKITDGIYTHLVDGISKQRNISKDDVRQAIDEAIITGKQAFARKLVDHLIDQDGLRTLIKDEIGQEINLINDYGATLHERPDFSNPLSMLAALTRKSEPQTSKKSAVAIIYAEGMIVDGTAESGLFSNGSSIGSEDLRRAFRMAGRDDRVKAIVLRIDSPGGSALASEVMWQAARHAAMHKPLIISIGSMAASGGYYLASSGDYIIADPTAIVGSIGVVGGKFVLKDLFEKLGVNTEEFTRGRNADLFATDRPFSDRQRRMVTTWMRSTYDQFTERVMTG